MNQMLELSGKDVKTVTIKWFQRAIMKSLEKWKKIEAQVTQPSQGHTLYTGWDRALRLCAVFRSSHTVTHNPKGNHYLVLGHCTHNKGTDHSREGSHSIWDSHENAGIARGNIQVVDIETYSESKHLKIRLRNRNPNTFWKIFSFPQLSSISFLY